MKLASDTPQTPGSHEKSLKFVKTPQEIEKMRIAGRLAAEVLTMIEPYVKAGVSTEELDKLCHDYIVNVQQAIPAPLGYHGYPKSICTSINHVICHGIPSEKKLKEGDILNIDITVIKDGYHGDTSKMFFIGKRSVLAQRLSQVAHECLWLGIDQVKPGAYLGDIGHAIQTIFHEPGFQVLHYGKPGTGMVLLPGMTFTIEPMINAGKRFTTLMPDQWTVVTKDRSLSAQWEHTVLCTETGVEILTLREEEKIH
jgi:methionyl aminopeptidase